MTIDRFIEKLKEWIKEKVTGRITVNLHEGGIRNVRLEKDIK